jgi:hypothetical protein
MSLGWICVRSTKSNRQSAEATAETDAETQKLYVVNDKRGGIEDTETGGRRKKARRVFLYTHSDRPTALNFDLM